LNKNFSSNFVSYPNDETNTQPLFLTKFSNIKFLSLNTRGSKSNLDFIHSLFSHDCDLIFLTETWLLELESKMLESLSNDNYFRHFADMKCKPVRGRPFGGKCIYFKKILKICNIEFLNSYVCLFLILFIHLPYDDLSNNSFFEYDCNLTLISDLIKCYSNQNFKCFIMGDFNADFKRNNRFDRFLLNFVYTNELQILNNYNDDYSYENGNYQSYIDHCLMHKNNNIISNVTYLINDLNNNSDHKPIFTTIFFESDLNPIQTYNLEDANFTLYKVYPNLDENETRLKFQQQVELFYEFNASQVSNPNNLEDMYKNITQSILQAYESLTKLISKTKYQKLKNFWFNDELLKLKKEISNYKRQNKNDPNYKNIIKDYKRRSRQIQRKNIKLMENKTYVQLDKLRNEKDKDKFWRKINKAKSNNNKNNEVDIEEKDLFNHFFNIFGKQHDNNSYLKEEIGLSMNQLDNSDFIPIEISESDLLLALKDTRSSKVCGPDGVSSILIKNCSDSFIFNILFNFFVEIFNNGYFPNEFNYCYIKPILKDCNSSNKKLSNVRPISLSNTLSQIFERILLSKMSSIKQTSKFQYGFKDKTFCTHALFAIKECIIPYIHDRKTQVYGVTIDAEKAFDALWRDALFYKLLKTLPFSVVKILKNYYCLHCALIKTNVISSQILKIINGVKQGGILSPFLFNYFIDDLLLHISSLNLGY
jgi:hypothetical protein